MLTKLEAGLWVMSELLVALTALPSVELGIGLLWIFEVCVSLLVWPEVVGTAVSEEETAAVSTGSSNSPKKKGAWMSLVMMAVKWWGGGRTDSGRCCA